MDSLAPYWNAFLLYFREGLHHLNPVQGIVIAIVGGLMVSSVFGLFVVAFLAVIVHVIADAVVPMATSNAPFTMPALNDDFWHYAVTLYIAYFVVIGAIFLIKIVFGVAR